MKKLFSVLILLAVLITFVPHVFAGSWEDFWKGVVFPDEFDPLVQIPGQPQNAHSIDVCLQHKEFHFNERYNIFVNGLTRCKTNSNGVMSVAKDAGDGKSPPRIEVSTAPADEEMCRGRREGQILENGKPEQDPTFYWIEHCYYLGDIGNARMDYLNRKASDIRAAKGSTGTGSGKSATASSGPGSVSRNSPLRIAGKSYKDASDADIWNFLTSGDARIKASMVPGASVNQADLATNFKADPDAYLVSRDFEPIYTGPGVKIPDQSLVAEGISKETSLIRLIVYFTNASLPYVSVVSVFVFVAAGLYYILSFTNEELNTKAKTMMTYVVIGIIIIFSAYTIVNTLLKFALSG